MKWYSVVLGELSDLACLLLVQLLGLLDVLEILVICPDFYIFSCSHQVVSPLVEREHNCEQFLVINFIISLCDRKRLGQKCDWAPFSILFLRQHSAYRSLAGIRLDSELAIFCGYCQYHFFGQQPF